jgi:predicted deacetylase
MPSEASLPISSSAPRALVVSLHDVSPHTRENCEQALTALDRLGVKQCSLLVIPDHHHRGHFLADPAFCAWLKAQADYGHEIVIHGYYHQRERRSVESTVQKLTTRFYTADEGEFYDLDRPSAAALVQAARADFQKLGLDPSGFIAPAWLLSREAEAVLRDCGCEYTTRLGSVLDLRHARLHPSQSLVWSVRSAWRRKLSLAWNALLFRRLAGHPLLRISIHPVDAKHRAIWAQITSLLAWALSDRIPLTYQNWLTQNRASLEPPKSARAD